MGRGGRAGRAGEQKIAELTSKGHCAMVYCVIETYKTIENQCFPPHYSYKSDQDTLWNSYC